MRQRIRKKPMSEINVVPYIDVMLVLLIIFMMTAPLLNQGIEIDLPQTSSEPLPPNEKEPVIVSVDKDGNYFINYGDNQDKPVSTEELLKRVNGLLKYQPNIPILIGGDANVAYGKVIEAMSLLQQAGAPSIGMMTEPPTK
ncbi:MAG TPA: protein TolR [Thiotrichaceae bacterium]|jgi:biopolymer transport protein TolR|nr:protein TolR [Thiotrichaceae bacterium]HIM07573.1 protein TolR [Gammaproteobacteria bacterium]